MTVPRRRPPCRMRTRSRSTHPRPPPSHHSTSTSSSNSGSKEGAVTGRGPSRPGERRRRVPHRARVAERHRPTGRPRPWRRWPMTASRRVAASGPPNVDVPVVTVRERCPASPSAVRRSPRSRAIGSTASPVPPAHRSAGCPGIRRERRSRVASRSVPIDRLHRRTDVDPRPVPRRVVSAA